ncbi:MAG: GTPase HflX [Ruminococcaceae bacterium]|nr:GTPase HflX [Oscillospiraceae bacterium]
MQNLSDNNNDKLYITENKEHVNVLLAAIYPDNDLLSYCEQSLDELRLLAETSIGDDAVNSKFFTMTQCREKPDVATYLGYGKAIEAGKLCFDNNISLVVIDGEMSPSQIRNLEKEIVGCFEDKTKANVKVIDRTMLILDIFAKHAVTGEGKLQVEIAQLKYTAPRLTGRGVDLSRQGGTSGSIGSRGPGETKLETDRRHIQRRIIALKNALSEMEKDRSTKRSKRIKSNVPLAVISGYTNAGKSTLLNYLTDANILAEDKLFATLDPTVRKLTLPSGRNILLSDTVGFISRLPHGLVEAFKSTLDEVRYADIVLIVIDASDENAQEKTRVTEDILCQLDSGDKPTIYVFNKCDRLEVIPAVDALKEHDTVCISAKTGDGVDNLLNMIDEILAKSKKQVKFLFPYDKQGAVNNLYENSTVVSTEYVDGGVLVEAIVDAKCYGMYENYIFE